jgi:hypothetical protein
MRKTIFLLLSATILSTITFAQRNGTIKGVAFDTISRQPVANATITVMKKKDSSLVSFTMTNTNGSFELTNIPNGEYRLLITHVKYHNTNKFFVVDDEHKNINLGTVLMNDKNKVLNEVVVVAETPAVTLVGDTIQYNANSFKTPPNANVEDLLKRLPGVKVDKDGTIKAQGEKVQKVLVDGKNFFGNDPKIATKNLPADVVDKVQVFDRLSDQAQLTGFDDGNSEKTINLKLKKDKKKGLFGKVETGGGNNDRYQGKFNVNSFKGARQMSAIGMGNNTNSEGFSFMDILNFTGALNQLKNGGDIHINITDDDPLAGLLGGNNTGINTTWGGGINYNNIIGTKTDFQSNYFYSRYNPNRITNIQRQYFFPANLYFQNSNADNLNISHRLNFNADYQIDSFHSIKISPNFNYQQTRNKTLSDYTTWNNLGKKINEGNSDNLTENSGYSFSTNILFRKKFHRSGRTFSLNLLTNLDNSSGDGKIQSNTNFYNSSGVLFLSDSINQKNITSGDLKGLNVKAVYTEPIFKRSLIEFSAGKSNSKNTSSKLTYDYNRNNGKFDLVNQLLTNDFENSYGYTTAGLRFRKQTKKYNYAMGISWQQAELQGKIISGIKDSLISKSFTNFLPNARFQYNFSKFKTLVFNYSASTNQPSVSQLQPVPDNSNPLYIKSGNPDLKQEFVHSLRMNARFINPYKNRNFFAFFTIQQTQNKIVNYDKINNLGVDSVMPVNINGIYTMNGTVSFGFPVRFLKGFMELSSNISQYHGKQFIDAEINTIKTITVGPQIHLDMNPAEKLNISLSAGLNYSKTKYSVQSAKDAKYFIQDYVAEMNLQIAKGFFFATDLNYRINNQFTGSFNAKVPLWNAHISKQILHFNRGEIKFSVNDILDKNIAINRSTNQNYIEDTRVNTLRRFFLLSFTYSLSKTGLNDANSDGIKMITR